MTLVAIEDPDADVGGDSRASEPLLTIAPSQLLKPSGKIDLKTVAARVEIDDNADSATQESEAPGDASGRALMFGRYMGRSRHESHGHGRDPARPSAVRNSSVVYRSTRITPDW